LTGFNTILYDFLSFGSGLLFWANLYIEYYDTGQVVNVFISLALFIIITVLFAHHISISLQMNTYNSRYSMEL